MHKTYSPLRYPGGKSQFFEKVEKIILDNNLEGCSYLEPFAGGAGVGLRLLLEGKVNDIYINDNDYCVYCFWYSILHFNDKFVELIRNVHVTLEEWHNQRDIYLNPSEHTNLEIGFATFFLNRTNRSGILKAGPIGGKSQSGNYKIDCRFNKKDLIQKIQVIGLFKNRIKLSHLNAKNFIKKFKNLNNSFWFIDPPYFNKGSELYKNYFTIKDHTVLSNLIKQQLSENHWILTYDFCNEIYKLYDNCKYGEILLTYSVENKRHEKEYLFYNNLNINEEIFYGQKY